MSTAVRGCGTRVAGGIYLVTEPCFEVSDTCRPVFDFITDPPVPTGQLHLSALGSQMLDARGYTHVVDVVGREHYPNVSDFIMESARMGVSRRISKLARFERLSVGSRLMLAHERAIILTYEGYHYNIPRTLSCPTDNHDTPLLREHGMCAAYWWHDVEGGDPQPEDTDPRLVKRTIGSTTYWAHSRPMNVSPVYEMGFFMSLPIGKIEVVRDRRNGKHEQAEERARRASVSVGLVDQ